MELKVPVRKDAPGPSRRSLLLSAFRADPEKTLDSFLELQHAYGDIVRLPFPGATFYMLMHPDYVEHVLIHKYRNYAKDRVLRAHRAVFGNGLLTNEGETWLQMRRLLQPAFHRQQVEGYGKIMVDLTQQALEGWRVGEARDVQAEMGKLTLDIVVRALFGVDGGEVVYRTAAALNAVMDHVSAQFVFPAPLPDWLPTRVNRDYRKAVKTLDAIVWDIVHRRRLKFEPGEDLLGTLLQVRDEADRGLTDRQLRDELVTMILAGHETTAQALTFTFYLLARHPKCGEKTAR